MSLRSWGGAEVCAGVAVGVEVGTTVVVVLEYVDKLDSARGGVCSGSGRRWTSYACETISGYVTEGGRGTMAYPTQPRLVQDSECFLDLAGNPV